MKKGFVNTGTSHKRGQTPAKSVKPISRPPKKPKK